MRKMKVKIKQHLSVGPVGVSRFFVFLFSLFLGFTSLGSAAYTTPAPGEEVFSKLRAEGTVWMNEQNEKVSLRGINLGNWLLMEMWMFGGDQVFGSGIVDQCTFEDALVSRFGESEKERILTLHRDSWITESDWDVMEEAGFNLVRIPFPYDLIEDDNNPKTLRIGAWDYLDWAIAEAKERKMYVILDLHGAAGRQGWEHHSGCAGKNELWGSSDYRERTIWLWERIAFKYKDEDAIAGYGLLNEPWGTSPAVLRDFVVELYDAVRRFDNEHIVILPGHNSGISAYGNPVDLGMQNVAFEMHFYPGIFGWGEIGFDVHNDWLTCASGANSGTCEWDTRLKGLNTPFLVGEMQPWTGLGELGGEVTKATFDRYNQLDWAATAWSLKTVSNTGGLGSGPWGLMTNQGDQLLVKSSTWDCDNWESSFANACAVPARSTMPNRGAETETMYLVLKTGSMASTDIVYDEIQLTNDQTGENIILNGSFGSASGWQSVSLWNNLPTLNYNYTAGAFAGTTTGPALRITAPSGGHNVALYQPVQVEPGASYTISGKFKDLNGSDNQMWSEIYLVPSEPQQGVDVTGTVLSPINLASSSTSEIEEYFTQFASMEYVVNPWVMSALAPAPNPGKYAIENPSSVTSGPNAIGGIVADAALGKDVVSLGVFSSGNPGQSYVVLPLGSENLSTASSLEFKVLDQQGSNTIYITLVDSAGATWSSWTDNATPSVLNSWTTIQFDYSAAAVAIDLTQVSAIRFAQWHTGSYRFSDVALLLPATDGTDTDNDGIPNSIDADDDNDGTGDNFDAFPLDASEQLDTDSDGIGNNADSDDDGDGINDSLDIFPLNALEAADSDGDGVGDNADRFPNSAAYSADTDLDSMPDSWERKYGLNPSDPGDAALDQDNDGATALEEYLAGTIPLKMLDIDADGTVGAMSDGIIILRYLFGFTGYALVANALSDDAMRTDPEDIEAYLQTLVPEL